MKNTNLNLKELELVRKGLYLLGRQKFEELEDNDYEESIEKEYNEIEELYQMFYSLENELEEEQESEKEED